MNVVSSCIGLSRAICGTLELNLNPSRQPLRQQNTETDDMFQLVYFSLLFINLTTFFVSFDVDRSDR